MGESAAGPGSVGLAERLVGMQANREVIPPDPSSCVRWVEHDHPSPVARWNYHPEYEIHLIRRSSGRFIVGDHVGTFDAGHVSLIGSGLPHDWVSDLEPGEVVPLRDAVVQFDGQWLRACARLVPELADVDPLLEESARGIQFLGSSAADAAMHIEAIGRSAGLERLTHLVSLFAVMVHAPRTERRYLADTTFQPDLDAHSIAVIDLALDYLFTQHTRTVRMSEAARLAGLSESAFSRQFKRSTGQNFSEVLGKLRLAHACRLLERTDLSISEICFESGFTNLSNFNRRFLAAHGRTPREYRRLAQPSDRA